MKNLKPFVPHIVAVLIFFVLASVYFAPTFSGYSLSQGDFLTTTGMSQEIKDFRNIEKQDPLWTNSMFGGMPAYQISMQNKSNIFPKIESAFTSSPFGYPIGYLFIAMISFYIMLLCFGVNSWLSIIGSIAFGFASINILYLGNGHVTKIHSIGLLPGIIGGIYYAYRKNMWLGAIIFSIFVCLNISANHIQQTYYFLFLALAIILVEFYRSIKEKLIKSFFRISALLIIAAVIGILPTVSNLLLTNEYAKYTTRGASELTVNKTGLLDSSDKSGLEKNYIKQYSLGYGEVWSVAIPNIKGGASNYLGNFPDKMKNVSAEYQKSIENTPSYWGEQLSTGGAFYFGATIFLLCILGLFFIKDRIKWALLIASILAVILSWKYSSILDIFIDNIPLFNKFRDTKMILLIVQISMPLLALLFLNVLFTQQIDRKKLNYVTIGTIGVFIIFYLMPTVWFSFFSANEISYFDAQLAKYVNNQTVLDQLNQFKSELESVRISIYKGDLMRSILFMLAVGGIIILYSYNKLQKKYVIAILGFLILIDLWVVDKRYLNNEKLNGEYTHWKKEFYRNFPFTPSIADRQILNKEISESPELEIKVNKAISEFKQSEKNNDNVELEKEKLSFTTMNFSTDFRVFTLQDPFSNATVSYFHKSIGGYHGAKLKRYQELIEFRINKEYQTIVSALESNNDTLIRSTFSNKLPTLSMLNTRYIIYNPEAAPLINPSANGSVWFIKEVKFVDNADEEILSLDSINPKITVVIDKRFADQIHHTVKPDITATIELKSYKPNHLEYLSNTSTPQVGVFSEIYYKDGWNAYIDGKLAPYVRANYVLRAMDIPAGSHKIEFKFEPRTYTLGKNISCAGSVLLILFIIGGLFFNYKRKAKLLE